MQKQELYKTHFSAIRKGRHNNDGLFCFCTIFDFEVMSVNALL